MKILIEESGMVFSISLEPESVQDSALLVRLALNSRRQPPTIYIAANHDQIKGQVLLAKVTESAQQIYVERH